MLVLLAISSLWITVTITQLYHHAKRPVDAILVLGGSIKREMYVAEHIASSIDEHGFGSDKELAKKAVSNHDVEGVQPNRSVAITPTLPLIPILISKGSKPPCIKILFERADAATDNVWIEDCAQSTFDNYRYSLPTLRSWKTQHVKVITSPTHLPRAQWLAQIILGSHGIWVEMDLVDEEGIPGNVETSLKTGMDVTRALLWAVVSQVYNPICNDIIPLSSVDLAQWEQQGFKCEHQANID